VHKVLQGLLGLVKSMVSTIGS